MRRWLLAMLVMVALGSFAATAEARHWNRGCYGGGYGYSYGYPSYYAPAYPPTVYRSYYPGYGGLYGPSPFYSGPRTFHSGYYFYGYGY